MTDQAAWGMQQGRVLMAEPLTDEQLSYCARTMSSEALAAIIVHRLVTNIPTSVVRQADGEKCIIARTKGEGTASFLEDPTWLAKYGLTAADLDGVAEDLLWAGNNADFFAPSVSGLWRHKYNLYPYFENREQFVDVFYHRMWAERGRVAPVLQAARGVIVLHRDHEAVAANLKQNYGLQHVESFPLSSWKDQEAAKEFVQQSRNQLVLVSGGPAGKRFIVELAADCQRVVLDVGGAMTQAWCKGLKESL